MVSALILVVAISFLIYMVGRLLSPKPVKNEDKESSYACGEKADFRKIKITMSLHKYLVYFVILDSSLLLIAFASLAFSTLNFLCILLYLLLALISSFLLIEGGEQ